MNLNLPAEVADVAALARRVGEGVLSVAAPDAESQGQISAAAWETIFETGLAVPVTDERGDTQFPSPMAEVAAVEALAYGDLAISLSVFTCGAAWRLLAVHGTEAQRKGLRSLTAQSRSTIALHEGFGRSPREFETTIERTARGVHIRGTKIAVPLVAVAEQFVVLGIDPSSRELRAAMVPAGTNGLTVARSGSGLALDAAGLGTVEFDLELSLDACLDGDRSNGVSLEASIARTRLIIAAMAIGVSQRAVDYAARYATERVAFGKPIAAFQGVSFPLAEAQIRIEVARTEVRNVAAVLEQGWHQPVPDITAVVNYAGSVAVQTTRDAVQVLGGHGFITDHPVEFWYRGAAALAAIDVDPCLTPFNPAL